MENISLAEIVRKVSELSSKINVQESLLPSFGFSRDLGYPHIEVDNLGYHYIVVERGVEWERKSSTSIDDLFYWIFKDITSTMAIQFEMKNRVSHQDSRVIIFSKQIELLSLINVNYANRLRLEFDDILKTNPFTENLK